MTKAATSGAERRQVGLDEVLDGLDESTRRLAGDTALIAELAELARRLAMQIVGEDVADDIAQEIVIELFNSLDERGCLGEQVAVHAMVHRRVRSRCVDWLRQSKRRRRRELMHVRERRLSDPTWMSPDALFEDHELAHVYKRLIAGLPPLYRQTFVMIREERLSYHEVARALGLPRSAVHGHMVAASVLLRDQLRLMGIVRRRRKPDRRRTTSNTPTNDRSKPSCGSRVSRASLRQPTRRAA